MQKANKNAQQKLIDIGSLLSVRLANFKKFALQNFIRLVYKKEASKSLVTLCLHGILDYYSHNISL